MPKVKICGLRTMEDIQAVNSCKPDFAGFIVEYPKSRRSITSDELKKLIRQLDTSICAVGVFVNAPFVLVADLLDQKVIQMAQLHGQEEEAYIRQGGFPDLIFLQEDLEWITWKKLCIT